MLGLLVWATVPDLDHAEVKAEFPIDGISILPSDLAPWALEACFQNKTHILTEHTPEMGH